MVLLLFFRQQDFALVHSVTPKAGLLAMTAARLAGVRHRIHTFTGQVWVTKKGGGRFLLKMMDRILAWMTSQPLVDSPSQRDFLVQAGVLRRNRGRVLGNGSISGVDTRKFKPDSEIRKKIRQNLGIPEDSLIFLFLGRINRDKGVLDLAEAYCRFRELENDGHLLLVGPDEAGMRPLIEVASGEFRDQVYFAGKTSVPQDFMAASDVFCLPSYREGFGSVIIEAASCGIPAIGSRIYGITDAIVENETGLLHEPGNTEQLQMCMTRLAQDDMLRRTMGLRARKRSLEQFSKEILNQALVDLYHELL
jgi:glycosyltransferase involved in cell wall biosynthesis